MENQIYRFYSPAVEKSPRVTVVGTYDQKNDSFNFAAARCSAKDKFNRKIGRSIAEGRLKKNITCLRVPGKTFTGKEFVVIAAEVSRVVLNDASTIHFITA